MGVHQEDLGRIRGVHQLFVGASLGAGIDKVLDQNNKMPTITEALMTPDIYIPILALLIIFLITLIFRKKFFKN